MLDRYVFREFLAHWLTAAAVLFSLVFASQFTRALERAAESGLPSEVVPRLALVTLAQSTAVVLPVTLVIAIVLSLGRLYYDSEMTAMRSSGVSAMTAARSIVAFSLALSALLAWFTVDLAPRLAQREQSTLAAALRRAQLAALEPGRFTRLGSEGPMINVARVDADGTLRGIFIARRAQQSWQVVTADSARFSLIDGGAAMALSVSDGVRVEGTPGSGAARRFRFETYVLEVALPTVQRVRSSRDVVSTPTLMRSADLADVAELQWRLSVPLMCAVLALVAVPLARLRPRQGRYARIGPALLLVFAYINLLGAGRSMIASGRLAAWPGMSLIHAGLLSAVLLYFGLPRLRQLARRARRHA